MAGQRSTDLSIADHITRSYGKSGLILVNRTDLDIFRKRVDRIETERGPTRPWLADMAEARPVINCRWQQICISSPSWRQARQECSWRIDREAIVDHLAPRTEGPLEVPTPTEAQVIDDVEAIPDVAQLPEMRSLSSQVINLTELRRLDIRIATELLAADITGQSRIHWRRDAERIVICRGRECVVYCQEAAVGGAEITDIEAHIRRQLTLDGNRALPVVGLFVEASQRIFRPVSTAGYVLTEGKITPLPALAIGKGIFQIAVRNVITVRIGPAPRRALGCVRHGKVHSDTDVAVRIPAQRCLDRCLAVAE